MKLHTPSVVLTKTLLANGNYSYKVDVTVLFQGEYYTFNYDEDPEITTDANGDPLVILKVEKRGTIGATSIAPLFIHAELGELTFNGPDSGVTVRVEELGTMASVGTKGVGQAEAEEDSLGGNR